MRPNRAQLVVEVVGSHVRMGMVSKRTDEIEIRHECEVAGPESAERRAAKNWVRTHKSLARRAILRLPNSGCLVKVISLPLAAQENIRQVLAFEMDRHTPYRSAQVHFGFEIVERSEATDKLYVCLMVTERAPIDAAVERLVSLGVRPVVVQLAELTGPGHGLFNIDIGAEAPPAKTLRERSVPSLAVTALVLLIATISVPIWQKHEAVLALDRQIAEASKEARQTVDLRSRLLTIRRRATFLAERRRTTPLVVDIVAELTHLLPDDVWLQSMEIDSGKLRIQGDAKNATRLIGFLAGSKYFRNPAFIAAVQSNLKGGTERFTLQADIPALATQ